MNYQGNKQWSSTEDFKKGDIITDGIILGKSKLQELRERGIKIHTEDMNGKKLVYFTYVGEDDMVVALISRYTYKDLEGKQNLTPTEKAAIFKLYDYVFSIFVPLWAWNSCPLLLAIGIERQNEDEEFDFDEISDLLEEKGYIRIENIQDRESERCMEFVLGTPNSNGDYVFVCLDTEQETISFSVNLATECTSFITGEPIRFK